MTKSTPINQSDTRPTKQGEIKVAMSLVAT